MQTPSLLDRLYAQLDEYRLQLLRESLPSSFPASTQIILSGFDRTLILLAPAADRTLIENHLKTLQYQSRYLTQSESISLYIGDRHIWTQPAAQPAAQPALDQFPSTCPKLEESFVKIESDEAIYNSKEGSMEATLEKPATAINPNPATKRQADRRSRTSGKTIAPTNLPLIDQLQALAKNLGTNTGNIAIDLLRILPIEMVEHGLSQYIDQYIETEISALKAQRRDELLNGKSIAATATNGAKPVKSQAPLRFKKFEASKRGIPTTLTNFLKAQKWSAEKQTTMLQDMANLPLTPAAPDSLPEQALNRVLAASKDKTRKDVIAAAKKLLEKTTAPTVNPPN